MQVGLAEAFASSNGVGTATFSWVNDEWSGEDGAS